MMISSLDRGMGGRVRAAIGRVIPTNHEHDPLRIPNAARHPPPMVVHSRWRAAQWKIGIYPRRLIPTTTQLALQRNTRKIGMMISKWRRGITRRGSPSCLRRDGGMCERRAGTMSWRWKRNATTWTLSSGAETRRTELSLLARGVLRFLGLHLRILHHHHPCRSSRLITNTHLLNLSLVLQRRACFPSQIPSIPIHRRPLLFTVPIRVRCPALPYCPLRRLYTKSERGGGYGRRAVPSEKGQSSWSIWPVAIRSRTVKVCRGTQDQRRPRMSLL